MYPIVRTAVIRFFGVLVLSAAFATPTLAQGIPPHYPGQICFTPYFWCWLDGQFNPPPTAGGGYVCYCSSQMGWVQGVSG